MSIGFDASAPADVNAANASDAFAAFTAPTDTYLACLCAYDTSATPGAVVMNLTDSTGATWTKQVERTGAETTVGGASAIWTLRTVSAVARTITLAYSTTVGSVAATMRKFAKIYVMTLVDVDGTPIDTVGANNEGGFTTNGAGGGSTTSLTPGGTGVELVTGCEWSALGSPTSSNLTGTAYHQASAISGFIGRQVATSGAALTANLNAFGTTASNAQWKYCQVIIREAVAAAFLAQQPYQVRQAVNRSSTY